MTTMKAFISESARRILDMMAMRSCRRGEQTVCVPANLVNSNELRMGKQESDHEWLERVADSVGDFDGCLLEDNILIVGKAQINDGELNHVDLQALVTENGTIEEFYLGGDGCQSKYFRLDFDFDQPGPLFKEPLPHIHVGNSSEPRFSLPLSGSSSCILDFIEFLYLNYRYDLWLEWARNTWLDANNTPETEGIFNVICEAFNTGQTKWLCNECKQQVESLRNILHRTKISLSRGQASIAKETNSLNYNSMAPAMP